VHAKKLLPTSCSGERLCNCLLHWGRREARVGNLTFGSSTNLCSVALVLLLLIVLLLLGWGSASTTMTTAFITGTLTVGDRPDSFAAISFGATCPARARSPNRNKARTARAVDAFGPRLGAFLRWKDFFIINTGLFCWRRSRCRGGLTAVAFSLLQRPEPPPTSCTPPGCGLAKPQPSHLAW